MNPILLHDKKNTENEITFHPSDSCTINWYITQFILVFSLENEEHFCFKYQSTLSEVYKRTLSMVNFIESIVSFDRANCYINLFKFNWEQLFSLSIKLTTLTQCLKKNPSIFQVKFLQTILIQKKLIKIKKKKTL